MDLGSSLTEPGVRSFVRKSLIAHRQSKNEMNCIMFNIGLLLAFVLIFGGVLYWRYNGKPNLRERAVERERTREYIISKLQTLADIKKQVKDGMITNLPILKTPY